MSNNITNLLARLWLSSAESLSYKQRKRLEYEFSSAEEILSSFSSVFIDYIGEKSYMELSKIKALGLERLYDEITSSGIKLCLLGDPDYPYLLSNIQDPPDLLYYFGCLPKNDDRLISIVGSRRETAYGRKQAFSISKELAENACTVVSGLAYGIDSAAHKGALEARGKTIAVLGSGLKNIYPKDNIPLAREIAEKGGAIISEFPPLSEPLSFHFPIRNRIVSGLSSAVLLIEAREKSGTMITINHALNQGREVFALPGPVDVSSSVLPNRLIREGARCITSANDILVDIGWAEKEISARQTSLVSLNLTKIQQKIYYALSQESLSLEELQEKCGIDMGSLLTELSFMELNEIIEALPYKRYRLC